MNKEEQEAIEYIKELIKPPLREEWDFAYKLDKTTAKQFKILINYIDKLQEENEQLKEENFDQVYMKAIADYKEKIRDKIKELEKTTAEELRYDFLMNRDEVKRAVIEILKELLN